MVIDSFGNESNVVSHLTVTVNGLTSWLMYIANFVGKVSFSVGTRLTPHPNTVIAHCKQTTFCITYCFLETIFGLKKKCFLLSIRFFNILSSLDLSEGWERWGGCFFFVSNYNGGVIAVADGVSGYETQNFLLFHYLIIKFNTIFDKKNYLFQKKIASCSWWLNSIFSVQIIFPKGEQ